MKTLRWVTFFSFFVAFVSMTAQAETKSGPVSTLQISPTLRSQLLNVYTTKFPLKNFIIRLPLLGCINYPSDAPQYTLSTICRAISRCVSLPGGGTGDVSSMAYDACMAGLAEGEDRQLWNNLGAVPENSLWTSQLRAAILEGRFGVNAPALCGCMADISALTCEQISSFINGPYDFGNFENLIPETAECEGAFTSR